MEKKVNWFNSLLRDERGDISSKRVVGILSSLVIFTIAIRLAFTIENDTVPDSLINALATIACIGLGLTTFDKYIMTRRKIKDAISEKKDDDGLDVTDNVS